MRLQSGEIASSSFFFFPATMRWLVSCRMGKHFLVRPVIRNEARWARAKRMGAKVIWDS